mmetsp:Transcript_19623/g.49877  ORF Transcript_19623/g.49877 Transcript_19623/m.49877 type:complete len:370 (-) Transcript_19623:69-1178(-)|eukprot:CAMPEP_0180058630 /NCGR_PEP_ID=MMETSP0985-20121206/5115_1 /TAXON_ID=483367 /ORGANISM="non described non described, Strain CCMP 2436" /LENGTH=369 /DNA_ID=CAMNT_0021988607 /DNA_START=300 /DNA_END=1409 /DNA_ORIENTATION=+
MAAAGMCRRQIELLNQGLCGYYKQHCTAQPPLSCPRTEHSGGPCRDELSSCEDWAQGGECQSNPGFMRSQCPLACGFCADIDQFGRASANNSDSLLGAARCRDLAESNWCERQAAVGGCEVNSKSHAWELCHKSCGWCDLKTNQTQSHHCPPRPAGWVEDRRADPRRYAPAPATETKVAGTVAAQTLTQLTSADTAVTAAAAAAETPQARDRGRASERGSDGSATSGGAASAETGSKPADETRPSTPSLRAAVTAARAAIRTAQRARGGGAAGAGGRAPGSASWGKLPSEPSGASVRPAWLATDPSFDLALAGGAQLALLLGACAIAAVCACRRRRRWAGNKVRGGGAAAGRRRSQCGQARQASDADSV